MSEKQRHTEACIVTNEGGMFNHCFMRNLLLSFTVTSFDSWPAFSKVMDKNVVAPFPDTVYTGSRY